MPSWQAHVFNALCRMTLKPMVRFGSLGTLKLMTRLATDELPSGGLRIDELLCREVLEPGFHGELIEKPGTRRRRLILSFPGGGFVMRAAAQQRRYVARICRAADADALIVHYRLAPDAPFPGGLEDCLAAYHHLLGMRRRPRDITLMGESAGGGLVLSSLLALRDEGSRLPGRAIVVSALADLSFSGESRRTNRCRDPMLTNARSSRMHEIYLGTALSKDRFVSPVFADFDGLPPIMGIVGSTEILLDDTTRAAQQAARARVRFVLDVWDRMPHAFPAFQALPESRIAIERMAAFIRDGDVEPLPQRYRAALGARAPKRQWKQYVRV